MGSVTQRMFGATAKPAFDTSSTEVSREEGTGFHRRVVRVESEIFVGVRGFTVNTRF